MIKKVLSILAVALTVLLVLPPEQADARRGGGGGGGGFRAGGGGGGAFRGGGGFRAMSVARSPSLRAGPAFRSGPMVIRRPVSVYRPVRIVRRAYSPVYRPVYIAGVGSCAVKTADGYVYEALIPSAQITGFAPKAGAVLGMDLMLNVNGAAGKREVYWPWSKKENPAARTETWGMVKLGQ